MAYKSTNDNLMGMGIIKGHVNDNLRKKIENSLDVFMNKTPYFIAKDVKDKLRDKILVMINDRECEELDADIKKNETLRGNKIIPEIFMNLINDYSKSKEHEQHCKDENSQLVELITMGKETISMGEKNNQGRTIGKIMSTAKYSEKNGDDSDQKKKQDLNSEATIGTIG